MPSSHKKEKKIKMEEGAEREQPSLFAKKLADMKEMKRRLETLREEKMMKESKVYKLESSFISDFQDYQEAALQAGLVKEEDLTRNIGRLFSETSSSWMEALKNLPEMKNAAIDWEESGEKERTESAKSHKKASDKSKKRKR